MQAGRSKLKAELLQEIRQSRKYPAMHHFVTCSEKRYGETV